MDDTVVTYVKTCFKCGKELPLLEFYKHKGMADGHLNKCKDCSKKDTHWHYRKNITHYKAYEKKRFKDPQRKVQIKKYQQKRRIKFKSKYIAVTAVGNALRDGRIKKKPCFCGKLKVEAHHENYSKPLDVVWLCRKHHLLRHGKVAY